MSNMKGDISISLNIDSIITYKKSGNLLELSRFIEGSSPTDKVLNLRPLNVSVDEEWSGGVKFKCREIEKDVLGHGLYDQLVEVVKDGILLGMIYWSKENGDYMVSGSTISMTKNWTVNFLIERGRADDAPVVTERVDWVNMSKVEKYEFVLSKFSELLGKEGALTEEEAFELATHKHYKGGLYRELGTIRNADDGGAADRTLYLHLFPHENSAWHRDAEEFHGLLNTGIQRFAPIEDELPFILNDDGQSAQVSVVLRRLSDEPISGILFTELMAKDLLPKLNERAAQGQVVGEFGQPKVINGEISDWRVCCQFMSFSIQLVVTKRRELVPALVATVMPYGPEAMSFLDNMRKNGVGFAMRFFGANRLVDGVEVAVPTSVVTFDFVANKK